MQSMLNIPLRRHNVYTISVKTSIIIQSYLLLLSDNFCTKSFSCCLFPHRQHKSQQAVSDHVEYLRIFLRCWLFELPETFQVTVLRKTVTCSADSRAKSQHRQISTHRIRQNVGFLPGDFQKSQHRTHMNRPAPCKPPLPTAKKQHIPET